MGTQILVGDGFSTSSAVLLCGKRPVGRATGELGEASALGSVVVNIGGMLAGRLVQAKGEVFRQRTARALDTVFLGNACISSEVNRRTSSVAVDTGVLVVHADVIFEPTEAGPVSKRC